MIETLERPLSDARTGSRVVVAGTKVLTPKQEIQQRRRNGMSLQAPNLCLVPIDAIYEPLAAIPHDGGSIGDFLFIRPADNWGYGFTQLIEDSNDDEEEEELEHVSDGTHMDSDDSSTGSNSYNGSQSESSSN